MPEVPDSTQTHPESCPVRNGLGPVGDKWSGLVMLSLQGRRRRFREIKRSIGDIPQRVLVQPLRKLERDGYVARRGTPRSSGGPKPGAAPGHFTDSSSGRPSFW